SIVSVIIKGQLGTPLIPPAERASRIRAPGAFQVVTDLAGFYPVGFTIHIRYAVIVFQRTDTAADKTIHAIGPAECHRTAFTFTVAVGNTAAVVISRRDRKS